MFTKLLDSKLFIRFNKFLVNSSKHTDKSMDYDFLHDWLGTGLLTSGGEKWKTRRHLITPSFHFDILNDFLIVMNEQSEIFVNNLIEKSKSKKKFDICPLISSCALDIICGIIFFLALL